MTDARFVRPPAVAGTFYSATAAGLRAQVAESLPAERGDAEAIAMVTPHAGLMYSGHVAGALYASLRLPKRFIILCPNHTGAEAEAAINLAGSWRTPLGDVPIDEALATRLAEESPLLSDDTRAHAREHSLEVQLPFLQELAGDFRFVPICVALRSLRECEELGEAIARVIAGEERGSIALVASSDLNHYEDYTTTLQKDARAIEAMLALDPAMLWSRVRDERISMCGVIPATVTLVAARALGARSAKLIRHATSGDINGDHSAVVGYCAITFS